MVIDQKIYVRKKQMLLFFSKRLDILRIAALYSFEYASQSR